MKSYTKYKDSGIPWIGSLPEHWNTTKIKFTATLSGRIGWQGLTSAEYCDNGAYLITGVNFKNGKIDWNSCVHVPMRRWEEAEQIQIRESDLLITKDGTVGKVALAENVPGETSLNSGVLLIRMLDERYKRYLFWLLQSEVFTKWFSDINLGNSTILHLYQKDFFNFEYPLPSIQDAKGITEYLDVKISQVNSLIDEAKASIEEYKTWKASIISEAVTKGLDRNVEMKDSNNQLMGIIPAHWNVSSLSALSECIQNGYVGPTRDLFVDSGIRYIQSLHIKEGNILFDRHPYYVRNDWAEKHPKIHKGDLLIVQTGDIGQVGLVDEEYDNCNCHALIIVSPNKTYIYPEFIKYYFMSPNGKEILLSYQTGALLPHLNAGRIKAASVCYPSISEQKSIVQYLDDKCESINALIMEKESLISDLEMYKKSLIFETVTGKRKVV